MKFRKEIKIIMSIHIPFDANPYITSCSLINESSCLPAGAIYSQRFTKRYEFQFITWGDGFQIVEGNKIPCKKGDIFFYKPGTRLQAIAPYYCYWISFDVNYDKEKLNLYMEPNIFSEQPVNYIFDTKFTDCFKLPQKFHTLQFEKYYEICKIINNEIVYNGVKDSFMLKTYLMQILLLAREEWFLTSHMHTGSRSISINYPKVLKVKEHINKNVSLNFSLSELAEIAGLSSAYLCRKFKQIMGERLFDYILKQKLFSAKKLLIETNLSVKEISYQCGFENDTYFFTVFKKVQGMSPLSFKLSQQLYK